MQSCLRKEDTACRYGGEEFTLILPDMDAQGAFAVAERIRLKLETTSLDLNETDSVRITASIGIACLTREKSLETFIEKADDALYMAKKNGRNQTFIAQ